MLFGIRLMVDSLCLTLSKATVYVTLRLSSVFLPYLHVASQPLAPLILAALGPRIISECLSLRVP
jgi:hypothetical protein